MTNGSGDMTAAFASALEGASTAASETSPVSTPTPESTPAASSEEATAAATVQPAADTTAAESASADDTPKGEPPAWRWQDILANTRKTVAEETEARVKQGYEQQLAELQDFRSLSPEQRQGLVIWNRALQGDPAALQQVERVNPHLAAAMRGESAAPRSAEPDPEPQPDAAIQLADGSTVPVFTPEGMKKREAWLQKQLATTLKGQFSEEFKPLMQTAAHLQQLQQQAQLQQQTTQWAAQVIAPLAKLPFFDEFKPELGKALGDLPQTATDAQMQAHIYETYTRLHQAKLDALTKHGESKAVASLTQRAIAGTGNPAAPSAVTPGQFTPGQDGFAAALAHFAGADR